MNIKWLELDWKVTTQDKNDVAYISVSLPIPDMEGNKQQNAHSLVVELLNLIAEGEASRPLKDELIRAKEVGAHSVGINELLRHLGGSP